MHPTLALFRRHEWVNRSLLQWCAWQQPEVVAAVGEDVYGSIEASFNHIVGAESRYLRLLTGELPIEVSERSPKPLRELAAPVEALAATWPALLAEGRDIESLRTHERGGGRTEMPDWLPLLQTVHHGDDHRTQIGELLLRSGVMVPELDVWMFGFYNADPGDAGPPYADQLLRRFFGHHLWATRQLLERCSRLSADQLARTAPGTFGSIIDTCGHLVTADRGYWKRLAGRGPGGDLEDGSPSGLLEEWKLQRQRWSEYLDSRPDWEGTVETSDGWYRAWVIAAQAIHHGNDHRTHLGSVLLHHGLEAPEVDVWAYANAEGVLRDIA